jgi:hypothetical protein
MGCRPHSGGGPLLAQRRALHPAPRAAGRGARAPPAAVPTASPGRARSSRRRWAPAPAARGSCAWPPPPGPGVHPVCGGHRGTCTDSSHARPPPPGPGLHPVCSGARGRTHQSCAWRPPLGRRWVSPCGVMRGAFMCMRELLCNRQSSLAFVGLKAVEHVSMMTTARCRTSRNMLSMRCTAPLLLMPGVEQGRVKGPGVAAQPPPARARLQDVRQAREDLAGAGAAAGGRARGRHVAHHVVAQVPRQSPVAHKALRTLHLRRRQSKGVVFDVDHKVGTPCCWLIYEDLLFASVWCRQLIRQLRRRSALIDLSSASVWCRQLMRRLRRRCARSSSASSPRRSRRPS